MNQRGLLVMNKLSKLISLVIILAIVIGCSKISPSEVEILHNGEPATIIDIDLGEQLFLTAKKSGYYKGNITWDWKGAEEITVAETGSDEVLIIGTKPGTVSLTVYMQVNDTTVKDTIVINISSNQTINPKDPIYGVDLMYDGQFPNMILTDLEEMVILTVQKSGSGTLAWDHGESDKIVFAETSTGCTIITKKSGTAYISVIFTTATGEILKDTVVLHISNELTGSLVDTDGDGIKDIYDSDIDNDGIINLYDDNLYSSEGKGKGFSYKNDVENSGWKDTDGDGLHDDFEIFIGTKPTRADTDMDSFSDGYEIKMGTDPLDPDSAPNTTSGEIIVPPSVKITTNRWVVIDPVVPAKFVGNISWNVVNGQDDITIEQIGDAVRVRALRSSTEGALEIKSKLDGATLNKIAVYAVEVDEIVSNVSRDGLKSIWVPQHLNIQVGETISFNPIINGVQNINITGFNANIADVTYDVSTNLMSITGKGVGEVVIILKHKEYNNVEARIRINVFSEGSDFDQDPIYIFPSRWVTTQKEVTIKPIFLFVDNPTVTLKEITMGGLSYEHNNGTLTLRGSENNQSVALEMTLGKIVKTIEAEYIDFMDGNDGASTGYFGNPENEFYLNSFSDIALGSTATFSLDPSLFSNNVTGVNWYVTLHRDDDNNSFVSVTDPKVNFITTLTNNFDIRLDALISGQYRIKAVLTGTTVDEDGTERHNVELGDYAIGWLLIDGSIQSIRFSQSTIHNIEVGDTVELSVLLTPTETMDKNISWSFDDSAGITTEGNGVVGLSTYSGETNIVTALKPGNTKIVVAAVNDKGEPLQDKFGRDITAEILVVVNQTIISVKAYRSWDNFADDSEEARKNELTKNSTLSITEKQNIQVRVIARGSGKTIDWKPQLTSWNNSSFDIEYHEDTTNKFTITPKSDTPGTAYFRLVLRDKEASFTAINNPNNFIISTDRTNLDQEENLFIESRYPNDVFTVKLEKNPSKDSVVFPSGEITWTIISDEYRYGSVAQISGSPSGLATQITANRPGVAVIQAHNNGVIIAEKSIKVGLKLAKPIVTQSLPEIPSLDKLSLDELSTKVTNDFKLDLSKTKNPTLVASSFLPSKATYNGVPVLLPQMVGEVQKLEIGNPTAENIIEELGDQLSYFTSLRRLVLSGHNFSTLDVSKLKKLTYLDVSKNSMLYELRIPDKTLAYLDISECTGLSYNISRFGYNITDATIRSTPDIYFRNWEGNDTYSLWKTYEHNGKIYAKKWNGWSWYNHSNWGNHLSIDNFYDSNITAGGVLKATSAKISTNLTTLAQNLLAVDIDKSNYLGSNQLTIQSDTFGFFISAAGIGLEKVTWSKGDEAVRYLNIPDNAIRETNLITGKEIKHVQVVNLQNNLLGLEKGWNIAGINRENLKDETHGHFMNLALLEYKKQWKMKDYTINAPKALHINISNNYLKSGLKEEKQTTLTSKTWQNVYNDVIFIAGKNGYNATGKGTNKKPDYEWFSINYSHIPVAINYRGGSYLQLRREHLPNELNKIWTDTPGGMFSVTIAPEGKLYIENNAILSYHMSFNSETNPKKLSENKNIISRGNIYTVLYWRHTANDPGKTWFSGLLRIRSISFYNSHSAHLSLGHYNLEHGKTSGFTNWYAWVEGKAVSPGAGETIRKFIEKNFR